MIMKSVWVTVAAHPAVGLFAREVRAEMTVLFAPTATAMSGTGLIRQNKKDAACGPTAAGGRARRTQRGRRRPTAPECTNFARSVGEPTTRRINVSRLARHHCASSDNPEIACSRSYSKPRIRVRRSAAITAVTIRRV